MDRTKRSARRPSVEGLEGRDLLASGGASGAVRAAVVGPVFETNQIRYTTGTGARVQIALDGVGTLAGSSLDSSTGALNLVYEGTNTHSRIRAKVTGGSGRADLLSIRDSNVPLDSFTGLGADVVGIVRLPDFRLVSGGVVNLLGGVNELTLDSVSSNSQVRLRDTPLNSTVEALAISTAPEVAATTKTTTASTAEAATLATSATTQGDGTLDPTTTAFGGGAIGTTSGPINFIATVGNGQNVEGTPGLSQTTVSNGRSLSYTFQDNGGLRLTSVAGTFTPGSNLLEPRDVSKPGPRVPPPGVIVKVRQVNGVAESTTAPLGDPQIFGYDPTANTLVRFNAATGAVLGTTVLPVTATGTGGVGLARVGGRTLAVVGVGTTVLAYDATTGATFGQFSTANLANVGLNTITGVGSVAGTTYLADARTGLGVVQAINVGASLASGRAVTASTAFTPAEQFQLAGGLTGVPGTRRLFANGGAFFDSYQPNQTLAGVLSVTPSGTALAEAARVALKPNGSFLNTTSAGLIANDPSAALGSIESNLAVVTRVSSAGNLVSLYSPLTLASQGSVTLADPNALSDLSESFHPEIAGTALFDVQGNTQSVRITRANGLVFNGSGNLNLVDVDTLKNSTIVGLPVSHLRIGTRSNTVVYSSSRLIGGRNGVTVIDGIRPIGPLFLPQA